MALTSIVLFAHGKVPDLLRPRNREGQRSTAGRGSPPRVGARTPKRLGATVSEGNLLKHARPQVGNGRRRRKEAGRADKKLQAGITAGKR